MVINVVLQKAHPVLENLELVLVARRAIRDDKVLLRYTAMIAVVRQNPKLPRGQFPQEAVRDLTTQHE